MYFGVPYAEQDTDRTVELIKDTARLCGQKIVIQRYNWPGDGAWTQESLDKIIQAKLLKEIIDRHKSKFTWIVKIDCDEFLHEDDFSHLKMMTGAFSEEETVSPTTAIVTNYRQYCGSLSWRIDDPTEKVYHIFRSDAEPYFAGNDAMILKTRIGQEIWLDDIYLHHVGYCKNPELLTTKIKEHVVLNSSVYPDLSPEKLKNYHFEFPKNVAGKRLWPLGIASFRGQENECEYFPVEKSEVPKFLIENEERFKFI